jgi:glycosyltransferase involved in cell wall biosynthesis
MSCGLPILASNVGGIPETVRDGIDGLLCPPGDPASLRKNIMRLIDSAPRREQISISQRQRILKHYPWEHIAARYAEVYRSVLASSEAATVEPEKEKG